MASIKCGNCADTHDSVDQVKRCYQLGPVRPDQRAGYVSPEEAAKRRVQALRDDNTVNRQNGHVPSEFGQSGHVTNHGDGVLVKPSSRRERKPVAEGMYRKAGSIYKVQIAVHGSGKPYAKRLVETLTIDPKTNKKKWKFEYAPGFVNELRPEHALTLEQAQEFGALYGTCCVCGRTLTKEESISAGIGPVCAEKF